MRLYEIEPPAISRSKRLKPVTLRHLNKQKHAVADRIAAERRRKALLPRMYGRPVDPEAVHDAKIKAIELERELIDLEKERLDLMDRIAASDFGISDESQKAIERMAIRELERQKKTWGGCSE